MKINNIGIMPTTNLADPVFLLSLDIVEPSFLVISVSILISLYGFANPLNGVECGFHGDTIEYSAFCVPLNAMDCNNLKVDDYSLLK